ncbi:hypothetical protein Tco_0797992 [Tanacetum coccineum]
MDFHSSNYRWVFAQWRFLWALLLTKIRTAGKERKDLLLVKKFHQLVLLRQWDEEEKKRVMDEAKATKEIDWNDPSVIRYHSLKMKPKGCLNNEIRPIFEKLWDFNQKFVPMDADKESKKQKSPEKERSTEKIVEEEAGTQEERKEAVNEPAAKRKKSIPRKTIRKRQIAAKIFFFVEPDKDDEIWRDQHEYNLLSQEIMWILWHSYFGDGQWIGKPYLTEKMYP